MGTFRSITAAETTLSVAIFSDTVVRLALLLCQVTMLTSVELGRVMTGFMLCRPELRTLLFN